MADRCSDGSAGDDAPRETARVTIQNRLGMHARAAALFVQTASRFVAEVRLMKDGVEVNGKSIMGVLMLAAPRGSEMLLTAVGPDAGDAVRALAALIEQKFGEE